MSFMSAKIEDMKTLNWPLAVVVSIALVVIGVVAVVRGEAALSAVGNVILTVFIALGLSKLDEIRANTNGNNTKLLDELAQYRRQNAEMTNRAMSAPPLPLEDPNARQ